MQANEARSKQKTFLRVQLRGMQTAFAFLTLIPVGKYVDFSGSALRNSITWYPMVGYVIGAVGFLFALLLPTPVYLSATLILTVWLLLNGALHIDGLADCADAWVGGIGNRDKTLQIMKDPHCGAMGVAAITLSLLLKLSILIFVLQSGGEIVILLAPVLARLSAVALFFTTPYIGTGAIGQAILLLSKERLGTIVLLWTILAFLLFPWTILMPTLLMAVSVHCVLRFFALRRLQGFTGDCAGALIEITEIGVLLAGGFFLY